MKNALLIGLAAIALSGSAVRAQQTRPSAPFDAAQSRVTLNKYCVSCHNERLKTADVLLDKADTASAAAAPDFWERVIRKLRTGSMPPMGAPRPDQATYNSLASYLEAEIDGAASANPNPGRPAVHRLNRAEYANAIRDLLAIDFDGGALLPADDSGKGFDNLADLLTVSPVLMERYMSAASKVSGLAIGDREIRPVGEVYNVPPELEQDDRASEDLMFGSRGGTAIRHVFPLDGEYEVSIKLVRNDDGIIRGLTGLAHELDVRLDGAKIKDFSIGGKYFGLSGPEHNRNGTFYRGDPEQTAYEFLADENLVARFPAKAGSRVVGVSFKKKNYEPEGLLENFPRPMGADIDDWKGGPPGIATVTISGPFNAKGPGDTPSRNRIFVCSPAAASGGPIAKVAAGGKDDSEACAKNILSTLARRAYRRPVTGADVESLMKLYRNGLADGGFEGGIKLALQGVLVSPAFLFRIENDPPKSEPNSLYRIGDIELASRLSFFLWSSIPDDELLDLAEKGKLKDNAVLERQVRRMIRDPRSKALVENFAGQWLYVRNMHSVTPDPRAFPEFDDELRGAFEKETNAFVESMIRDDRPLLDMLTANYTFVNERLALHYGIPNVYGDHFRRVEVNEENRKGLLGQGAILTVTSRSNRTSPVLRGKWVLENLLGAPPPPPPPDVPPLKESGDDVKNMTMRQRMEQHRNNPVCAACHSRMDPIGFALDNFDAVGKFRATDGKTALDVTGSMPDGTKFAGPAELRKVIASHPDLFVRTVTEKLLTYALGREAEYYDAPAIRGIVREAAAQDSRWSAIVLGIVKSAPFQMRRTRPS